MAFNEFNLRRIYKKHPLLSQFSSSLPATIKELFEWMEFIVHNNAIAGAGVKKLSESPVTHFKYMTKDDEEEGTLTNENSWKSILEDSLNLKSKILNVSYNTELYGNCFLSVYAPINRFLTCAECGEKVLLKNSNKLKTFIIKNNNPDGLSDGEDLWESSEEKVKEDLDVSKKFKNESKKIKTKVGFKCACESCKKVTSHTAKDYPSKEKSKINIVVWNPHDIEISSNQISGEEEFFYRIPETTKKSIRSNDKLILATIPIPMIEASLTGNFFKFSRDSIYHSKRETVAGISTSWGMPSLTSAIPSILTLMVFRKANEKIASDYLVPLRTMFPAQAGGSGSEMYNFMGGTNFVSKLQGVIDRWKTDPSGVQITPFPIGTETILGDGKMLLVTAEIDQLESSIANSLGIPVEFIKGGLSYTAQGSSLRLLENQLERLSANLEDAIDFIVKKTSVILEKTPIKVKMVPFKIIDDIAEKSAIIQLAASGQGKLSAGTLAEIFNLDAVSEANRIMNEQKNDVKHNLELQDYQREVASSIEEKAKSAAQMNNSGFQDLNQQALMQEAQGYAEQLSQMDQGARKSQLDEMSKTNYIMYGVVKSLIEMNQGKEEYAAGKEAMQQQQQQ